MKKEDIVVQGVLTDLELKSKRKDNSGNLWRNYACKFQDNEKAFEFALLPSTPEDKEPAVGQNITLYQKGKNLYMHYERPQGKRGGRDDYAKVQADKLVYEKEDKDPGLKLQGIQTNIANIVKGYIDYCIANNQAIQPELLEEIIQMYLKQSYQAYKYNETFLSNLKNKEEDEQSEK